MTDYSHILFNKSPLQLRILGARGGKAFGRNERIRRALLPKPPPATVSLPAVPRHTVAEAVAALDACFPWLRGAERRFHAPRSGHPWRRESRVSFGRATPEQVLTAVQIELALIVKRLIACRNRISRDTGTYPDDPGAALQRAEFLLHDILGGLITPAAAKTETAQAPVSPNGRVSGNGCAGANRALSKTQKTASLKSLPIGGRS